MIVSVVPKEGMETGEEGETREQGAEQSGIIVTDRAAP